MRTYRQDMETGPLEPWPLDNPASAYRIVAGDPRTSGRLDAGGPGHPTRMGLWRCTPGSFDCTEQGDELMTVLSGRGEITDLATGTITALRPGESCFLRDGSRVRWTIHETLTKVFFGHKPGGY